MTGRSHAKPAIKGTIIGAVVGGAILAIVVATRNQGTQITLGAGGVTRP